LQASFIFMICIINRSKFIGIYKPGLLVLNAILDPKGLEYKNL